MSISQKLARYARELTFEKLPEEVTHQTKRLLLDTLGCALGGYSSDASRIVQEVIKERGGPQEATVIGSGIKTSCVDAAMVNGVMVRFLDFNDVGYITIIPPVRTHAHPSEVIPGILAVGEKERCTGREVIAAIVTGYELSARFVDGITGAPMENRGWNNDTRASYIMPLVLGKLMGLTEEQMVHAVGISGSHNQILGILDAAAEEYTMTKNLRFPLATCGGILADLLAQKGFTGPPRVIEGHGGFIEAVLGGDYDVDKLVSNREKFSILNTAIKSVTADFTMHGHLTATLTLVKEHNIKPEDVASVRVTTSSRCAWHTADPVKRYPKNKETADHSSYYLTAIGIIDRAIGPGQFSPEKYNDPRVRELIDKVTVESSPEFEEIRPAGGSEIMTKQGNSYSLKVTHPKGHPLNPMTDSEIEEKFRAMGAKFMNEKQIKGVFDAIWNLEQMDDVTKLMKGLIF